MFILEDPDKFAYNYHVLGSDDGDEWAHVVGYMHVEDARNAAYELDEYKYAIVVGRLFYLAERS